MARMARAVVAGYPHHVTQRGNRRQKTFFCEGDYQTYIDLMSEWTKRCGVAIWAYCLMPNHIHLIAVPQSEVDLRCAIGEAHRRYTRHINFREDWRGHLWQGRFASHVMDERYTIAAARYIELNPVRAGLAANPAHYQWSSAKPHINGTDDQLVRVRPLLEIIGNWQALLESATLDEEMQTLRRHERTGRPLGGETFVRKIERILGKALLPRKAGRPKKQIN
jgi:putative transposase